MITRDELALSFANEEKSIRHSIGFVLEILDEYEVFKPSHAKRYFLEISRSIYDEASTEFELNALQKALWKCYESAVKEQPHLLAPIQKLTLRQPAPFFSESTTHVGEIAAVLSYFESFLSPSNSPCALVAIALLLAKHSGITHVDQLFYKNVVVLNDANRVFISFENSVVILHTPGLLLWRRLNQSNVSAEQLRTAYASMYSPAFGSLRTFDDALSAASLLEQPLFRYELSEISHPLTADDMIAHLCNNPPQSDKKIGKAKANPKKRRVNFAVRECVQTSENLAFSANQNESIVISQLSLCLRRFQQQSELEHRVGAAFRQCKTELNTIMQATKRCSAVCAVLVHYCISLFLHGSAWKAKLRVSSVLNYLSTLHQFCANVLSDEMLLHNAQSDADALIELTELIDDYLATIAPNQQNTVLIFLQFIIEHVELRLVADSLDVFTEKVAATRTHYLSPHVFEQAMTEVNDTATRLFLSVCFHFGLRREEAATLFVHDVTADFIYVTRRTLRKTITSVRRISLMFMPKKIRAEFLHFVAMRQQCAQFVFDMRVVDFYLQDALNVLRAFSRNDELVVHSLRHCAANNILFMLMMAAFARDDWRERYALFQHELFSKDSIADLKAQCQKIGHALLPQSPIFSILAGALGHASPVVTSMCYLHFLPFLFFEFNALREKSPSRAMLAALLPKNSHSYQYLSDMNFDEKKWFKHAIRGVQKTTVYNQATVKIDANKFSFSDYVKALHDFLTTNKSSHAFQRIQDVPKIGATTLSSMLSDTRTLRQIEFISNQCFTPKTIRALHTLNELILNAKEIRDERTLRHVLSSLNCLGFFNLRAVVRSKSPIIKESWGSVSQRFDCTLQIVNSTNATDSISLTSFTSRQKKILYLNDFVQLTSFYLALQGVPNE